MKRIGNDNLQMKRINETKKTNDSEQIGKYSDSLEIFYFSKIWEFDKREGRF